MSTGSGALRIPRPGVSKTRLAIAASGLAAVVTAVALQTVLSRDGSETTEPVDSRPQVTQVEQPGPGGGFDGAVQERIEFTRGKQLGVGAEYGFTVSGSVGSGDESAEFTRGKQLGVGPAFEASLTADEPIVVAGEVCQICWKYR